MRLKSVILYQPSRDAMFQEGQEILTGSEKTGKKVVKITVNIFGTVKVYASDGEKYIFKRLPISYTL